MNKLIIFSFALCTLAHSKIFRFHDSKQCVISVSAENFAVDQKAEIVVTQNNKVIESYSGKIKSLALKANALEELILERSTLLSKLSDKQLFVRLRNSTGRESLEHDSGEFTHVPAGFFLVEGYIAPGNFVSNSTAHYCLGSK